jgi:transcriptional regulator with PAS, ATPase and Fis domain
MLYDRTGKILWQRGRKICGNSVCDGEGFSKSAIARTLQNGKSLQAENEVITLAGEDLPHSARILLVKSLLILPVADSFFLYVDSGIRAEFTAADTEVFRTLGELMGEMIRKIKANESPAGNIGGSSPAMQHVRELVATYAIEEEPVLLTGETGVGKNHIAELIHRLSGRSGRCVILQAPALPDHLLESELFGYRAGAFTDARQDKRGLIEEAEGGTLFFDEISETSTAFQAKLLQLIDKRRYRRLGDPAEKNANIRLIAASNRDLAEEVKRGSFRKDLFFRLNVLPLPIPPLRERRQDIRDLVSENAHLLRGKELSAAAWQKLESHDWPGNVRELLHALKRAGIIFPGPIIGVEIGKVLDLGAAEEESGAQETLRRLQQRIAAGESFWNTLWQAFLDRELSKRELREHLRRVFQESSGNLKAMAQQLHVSAKEYPRFVSALHKYEIHPGK